MLSILIPSYNHSRFVIEAISSARRINAKGKRIFVIDDASTDSSVEIVNEYLQNTGVEDITFIQKPINKGAIDSVLIFLSLCTTEYVYFMASDDIVLAPGIEELLRRLEDSPTLAFIIGGGINIFPGGDFSPIYTAKHDEFFGRSAKNIKRDILLNSPSPILCQSSVFRLSAIHAVGGFDPLIIADDFALFARLFQRFNQCGVDFEFLPKINCIQYRHHEINSYRNLVRQAIATRQVILALAPEPLRQRAAGYKLAYYTLIALRRLDLSSLYRLLCMLKMREFFWFSVGLFANSLAYIRRR